MPVYTYVQYIQHIHSLKHHGPISLVILIDYSICLYMNESIHIYIPHLSCPPHLIMTILLSLVTPAIHGPVISTVYIYTLYLAVDPRSNSNSRGGE